MAKIEKHQAKRLEDIDLPFYKRKWFKRYFIIAPIITLIVVILIIIGPSIYWFLKQGGIIQ